MEMVTKINFTNITEKLKSISENAKIAFITSGGTSVKLEKNSVRSLENFSTGKRGALLAESFLREEYYVIFFHRKGSCEPYFHHFTQEDIIDLFEQNELSEKKIEIIKEFKQNQEKLIKIQYETVDEYLANYEAIIKELAFLEKRLIILLAAAVSDYYIPNDKLSEHKIQSSHEEMNLTLYPVKKHIFKIKEEWSPQSFLISFKLETDKNILMEKIEKSLNKTKSDYIIGNILMERYDRVYLVDYNKDVLEVKREDFEFIEQNIVKYLINFHIKYMNN